MSTVTSTSTTTASDAHPPPPLSLIMLGRAPSPSPPTPRQIPLDIWFLILTLLPPRHAWRARNTTRSFRHFVERHLAQRIWFQHACIEVKWAPFFRIYDSRTAAVRDGYPLDGGGVGERRVGFVRPEFGGGGAGGGGGGRANLVKSLFLHEEVTVSFALQGEVSQPMKLQLRILSTNGGPEEGVEGEGEGREKGQEKGRERTMCLSANGRRIMLDWKPLLERACRQTQWVQLVS